MLKIFKIRILKESEYKELEHTDDKVEEYKNIIKETEIEKERQNLLKEYSKYVGNWYLMDNGYVIQIKGIRYKPHSYSWQKYCFEAFMPNNEDWIDIEFEDITEKKVEKLTEKQARGELGV